MAVEERVMQEYVASHRAFDIAELRAAICRSLDNDVGSLHKLCLVNSTWFHDAIKILWYRICYHGSVDDIPCFGFRHAGGPLDFYCHGPSFNNLLLIPEHRRMIYARQVEEIWDSSADFEAGSITALGEPLEKHAMLRCCQSSLKIFATRSRITSNDLTALRQCPNLRELWSGPPDTKIDIACITSLVRSCPRLTTWCLQTYGSQYWWWWRETEPSSIDARLSSFLLRIEDAPFDLLSAVIGIGASTDHNSLLHLQRWAPQGSVFSNANMCYPQCALNAHRNGSSIASNLTSLVLQLRLRHPQKGKQQTLLPYLPSMTQLKHLMIYFAVDRGQMGHGSTTVIDWAEIAALHTLHHLRSLWISPHGSYANAVRCDANDKDISLLCSGLPHLEALTLSMKLINVTEAVLQFVARQCQSIRSLRLEGADFDISTWTLAEQPRFPDLARIQLYIANHEPVKYFRPGVEILMPDTIGRLVLHHFPQLGRRGLFDALRYQPDLLFAMKSMFPSDLQKGFNNMAYREGVEHMGMLTEGATIRESWYAD